MAHENRTLQKGPAPTTFVLAIFHANATDRRREMKPGWYGGSMARSTVINSRKTKSVGLNLRPRRNATAPIGFGTSSPSCAPPLVGGKKRDTPGFYLASS